MPFENERRNGIRDSVQVQGAAVVHGDSRHSGGLHTSAISITLASTRMIRGPN